MAVQRVVITGIGAVTPIGLTFDESWTALLAGASGIGPITRFDPAGLRWRIAGEVNEFDPVGLLSERERRRLDLFIQYSVVAALAAADDAGFDPGSATDPGRVAVCVGTARGGIATIEENVRRLATGRRASAYSMPASTPFMATAAICRKLHITGPSLGISTACSSGAHALVTAAARIQSGAVDVVLAGGTEAPITPVAVAGYGEARALSRKNFDPEGACRPFCRDRDGFVLAEGATLLVLESMDHAQSRGALILAEIAGSGTSSDAYDETRPDPDGAARAIGAALKAAQTGADEVGAVSAHGTGTPVGDRSEATALRIVFGERMKDLPVYAVKSVTGHLLGASGALEAAFAVRALREGTVPPSRNFAPLDETLGLAGIDAAPRELRAGCVLCNSFGFGGGNAAIVLRKVK